MNKVILKIMKTFQWAKILWFCKTITVIISLKLSRRLCCKSVGFSLPGLVNMVEKLNSYVKISSKSSRSFNPFQSGPAVATSLL